MTDSGTSLPTVEEFLDEAAERLDALCSAPLTPAEHELWRICAQQNAALRMVAEGREPHQPPRPARSTP
jgi:hypothetical protein